MYSSFADLLRDLYPPPPPPPFVPRHVEPPVRLNDIYSRLEILQLSVNDLRSEIRELGRRMDERMNPPPPNSPRQPFATIPTAVLPSVLLSDKENEKKEKEEEVEALDSPDSSSVLEVFYPDPPYDDTPISQLSESVLAWPDFEREHPLSGWYPVDALNRHAAHQSVWNYEGASATGRNFADILVDYFPHNPFVSYPRRK